MTRTKLGYLRKPRNQRVDDCARSWLRKLRIDKGLTTVEMAAIIETSPKYIIDIEHGRKNPSAVMAMKMGTLLEFPIELFYDQPVLQELAVTIASPE